MRRRQVKGKKSPSLKVIPIGGLNEIGKNMTLLEYNDQILIIDCGMTFPEDEMYGIDIVIPDFSYIIENREKLVGMVITHGHEDHIGAIPYLLKNVKLPIYGTRLTLGLVENKLKEHQVIGDLRTIEAGDKIQLGDFKIETIRTTHSIADSICLAIDTPAGVVFHSGDFKIDYTPVDGEPIDFSKLAELGKKGVTLMMCDSTNAVRPGFTSSEKVVGKTIENIFRTAKTKIIIATFSSNVHRVQKIIENAVKVGRKVAISGRSMENVVALAIELGYLDIPAGTLVDLKMTKNIPDDKLVIITTGSQGEPMSALSRIASGEHKAVKLKPGDMVILSSTPVPGNEKTFSNVVNKLFEKGAEVIYSDIADIHVSGHACQEELKLIHSLIKPKFFMPVHGEYRHLIQHARLAESLGMKSENIFVMENGSILNVGKRKAYKDEQRIDADAILVDGLGVGDVGNIVLRDRKLLSESGLIIVVAAIDKESRMVVSGPDIISRGFVYVRENESLIEEARQVAISAIEKCQDKNIKDWNTMKSKVRDSLSSYIYDTTKRSPVILPIFLEV
ncbi:MAG: ribonuclease J [Firmicutes bacterium]|jgi:ribonuclease J|nr:ribonuclease J [Bacillota bacterium]